MTELTIRTPDRLRGMACEVSEKSNLEIISQSRGDDPRVLADSSANILDL